MNKEKVAIFASSDFTIPYSTPLQYKRWMLKRLTKIVKG